MENTTPNNEPRRNTINREELRNKYGRSTGTNIRRTSRTEENEINDIREKIVLQCIISGTIFAVILGLNVLGFGFRDGFGAKLQQAIANNVTTEYLMEQFSGVSVHLESLQSTVRSVLGNSNIDNVSSEQESVQNITEELNTTELQEVNDIEDEIDRNFKIDSEILNNMNPSEDNSEEKK